MITILYTAKEVYRAVALGQDYRVHHAAMIFGKMTPHDVTTPIAPYVNENRWLIDCECGAGNYVDMDAGVACCFGCGAVHTHVAIPSERADVEAVLLERPVPQTRGWRDADKSETVNDLVAENESRGVAVPASLARNGMD